MPKIIFKGKEASCRKGDNLRRILISMGKTPHNKKATMLNCKGLGTCGTCAVLVQGQVTEKTMIEKKRLNFPPHKEEDGLRLACQCKVLGDLEIIKGEGFWGEKLPNTSRKRSA